MPLSLFFLFCLPVFLLVINKNDTRATVVVQVARPFLLEVFCASSGIILFGASSFFHFYPGAKNYERCFTAWKFFRNFDIPVPNPATNLFITYNCGQWYGFENKRRTPDEFNEIATEIRRDIIKMLVEAGSGHSGGPLGTTDLYAALYFGGYMRYRPDEPAWEGRDRYVLSAGHMAPVLYATLANAGMFPKEELLTLRKFNTRLQGHPGRDVGLPGIETSAGSLGQGISIAVGMAMSDKLLDKNDHRVFTLTGDGELQEGSVWEAAMSASHFGLDNFCWLIDNNDCQIDGRIREVMNVYPIDEKCKSFGFDTIVIDGHNFEQICGAFDRFIENNKNGTGKPTAIIAQTFMGKGVSFMHDKFEWHGKPPSATEAELALKELMAN